MSAAGPTASPTTFALAAMRTIWDQLPTAFSEPANRQAREAMMLAATIAGIAFSNASVALVHGMSRPIGGFFHVPHGLSNAMLLPAVTAFSAERGGRALRRLRPRDGRRRRRREPPQPWRSRSWSTALYRLNRELQVPSPKQYGISEEQYLRSHSGDGGAGAGVGLAAEQSARADGRRDRAAVPARSGPSSTASAREATYHV